MTLPAPFNPPLGTAERGLRFLIDDASEENVADITVPGGPYDGTSGWTATARRWKYRNRTRVGIDKIVIGVSPATPGSMRVSIKGRNGSWPVSPDGLPLKVTIVLDPPCAPTGACGVATFDGSRTCALRGTTLGCR